jgi:hypothetical protein
MKRPLLPGLVGILMLLLTAPPASADPGFEALTTLTPGERYRQLSLVLLLAGATNPALIHTMAPVNEISELTPAGIDSLKILERYPEPLWRIANPEAMLSGAAQLFRYARENEAAIREELYLIEAANPILISMVDVNALVEEAIIIRSAIADSIQYLKQPPEAGTEIYLQTFREETVHLRNMMEYSLFTHDLDILTDAAILGLSGKLNAYQRMVDEDVDHDSVRERIVAAESMNEETRKQFAERSKMRTSQLLMMLIPVLVN